MVSKGVVVLAASLAAAILVEFISWLFIYRTAEYKRLKLLLIQTENKIESIRSMPTVATKSKKKKELRQEENKRARVLKMRRIKLVTSIITGAMLFVFYQVMTRMFEGQPVALLPFEPISLLTRITHYGLPGTRMREVSASCIYVLCQYSTKVMVSKVFNFGLTPRLERTAESDDAPWAKLKWDSKAA